MVFTMKQARMLKELSQQKMAELMGVHRHTYIKWERTPDLIPLGMAKKFAEIVKLKLDEIFFNCESTLSRQDRKSSA